MADISKQDLAIMNAELAARIFMHIAQAQTSPTGGATKSYELSDEEQHALREMFGSSDPNPDPDSTSPQTPTQP
jgi:hypothetical protein